jgi:hypothetical protein
MCTAASIKFQSPQWAKKHNVHIIFIDRAVKMGSRIGLQASSGWAKKPG